MAYTQVVANPGFTTNQFGDISEVAGKPDAALTPVQSVAVSA